MLNLSETPLLPLCTLTLFRWTRVKVKLTLAQVPLGLAAAKQMYLGLSPVTSELYRALISLR